MNWMLKISVEVKDKTTLLTLDGQVDETFALDKEVPAPGDQMDVKCSAINRINSTGVKKWMLYFQAIPKKTAVNFIDVSPALVEQFNLISNFGCTGKVVSLGLPYTCGKCKTSFVIIRQAADLIFAKGVLAPQTCTKCSAPDAEFDDIPEEYLSFLHIS